MDLLPGDIKRVMALNLNPPDLMNLCLTDKEFNKKVCDSNDFWRQKIKIDYPYVFDYYYVRNKTTIKNPKNLYIRKFTEIYSMIEKFVDSEFEKKYLANQYADLMNFYKTHPEIKNDIKKTIYNSLNKFAKGDINYDSMLNIVKKDIIEKYPTLRYFGTLDFEGNLIMLLDKFRKKDEMYIILN